MKGRKVLLVMAVAVSCILGPGACKKNVGTPEDNAVATETQEDKNEAETRQYKVGFSVIDMGNPYFAALESAVREKLEESGHLLVMEDSGTDPEVQEEQIREMIAEGIDAIILSPVDWEKITVSLQELEDAGIPVVNVDTQVKEMEYVDVYIGSDNYSAGVICGQDLIRRCPEGGEIAILECTAQNSVNERITGFEEILAGAENGFAVVAREDAGGEKERAAEAAERILAEHPDITAVMCGNDQMALGAKEALEAAQLCEVLLYGVDGSPDMKQELAAPGSQIAGTAAQSPIDMGKAAAEAAVNILSGEAYEREVYMEVFMIDRDNVDMYGVDGWQ